MTVVEGWFAGVKYSRPPRKEQLPADTADEIIRNICLNSKAFYIEEPGKKTEFVGNRTECALLQLCQKELGVPYDGVRKQFEDQIVQARPPCSCRLRKSQAASPAAVAWWHPVLPCLSMVALVVHDVMETGAGHACPFSL